MQTRKTPPSPPNDKKIFVSIYCKISTDTYPSLYGIHTGEEIFNHLMGDCGYCFDEKGKSISGDKNIWFLCTNEKNGQLRLKTTTQDRTWNWSFGESNWKIVKAFINSVYIEGVFTDYQYRKLLEELNTAKKLGDMYLISEYLQTIKDGKNWVPRITHTKQIMKNFVKDVKQGLEEKEFEVKDGTICD